MAQRPSAVQAGQEQEDGGAPAGGWPGLSLLTAAVKAGAGEEGAGLRFAFRVVSPAGTLALQAASEAEQRAWMAALQARPEANQCDTNVNE